MMCRTILSALPLSLLLASSFSSPPSFILLTSAAHAGVAAMTYDRQEQRVGPLPWDKGQTPIQESYAGHLQTREWKLKDGKMGDARTFYWFFPAIKPKVKNPPLIIWLQGGPGSSSMIGLFYENGPIKMTDNMKLARNNNTWAEEYSMLFVDQPVGTGFSFVDNGDAQKKKKGSKNKDNDDDGDDDEDEKETRSKDDLDRELEKDQERESAFFSSLPPDQSFYAKSLASKQDRQQQNSSSFTEGGFVKDEAGVVQDMLFVLDQFYERYPEQLKADLYIAGQSYAGKFVPSIAHAIMERNKRYSQKDLAEEDPSPVATSAFPTPKKAVIPIKGLSLGNSMTDPITQIQYYADQAYYLGLLTSDEWKLMKEHQRSAVSLVEKGQFLEANRYRGKIFNMFRNATELNTFDIRKGSHPMNWRLMDQFLNLPKTKDSLNIYGPRTSYMKNNPSRFSNQQIQAIEKGREQTKFKTDPQVKQAMRGDIMRSTKPLVGDLLKNKVKVLAYQGMFDVRDPPAGSTPWIEGLDWEGKDAFLKSKRRIWKVNGFVAGYVNSAPAGGVTKKEVETKEKDVEAEASGGDDGSGLTRIVMWGGGHYTPMDQPFNSLVMIRHLIDGTGLDLS
ncbi:hypothetical protein EMPS_09495 [Entomortierella parvispora]|uniref:Carboxypeptidase n=1 Tax=Entomortierella parvispora TaxID=205924 RepID=A0A9P3HIA5_9FUNG|nr:hypothetical protein EMPS_09495 [Entomortierella parvispora]